MLLLFLNSTVLIFGVNKMSEKDAYCIDCDTLAVWVATELNEIKADLQETLLHTDKYDHSFKRTEVLHKSLLLSKLHRNFDLTLSEPDYRLLFDLIANQVTFK